MMVFYYQYNGRSYLVCTLGVVSPGKNSPVWQSCSACAWLVPGTWVDVKDDDNQDEDWI